MPTSCVGELRCGAQATGWLHGSHPSVADGAVHATVCFDWLGFCCIAAMSIRVRNCSGFYVYELSPIPWCSARYCGNGGANYSMNSIPSTTVISPKQASLSPTASASTTPASPASVSCSFDNGLCTGWSQSTSDVFDWTLNSGSTPSLYTGPSSDLSGTGKYIYTEASSPRSAGDNAKLQLVLPRGSSSSCLEFFYHMYGSSMGTLNVFSGNALIFTASGNHGNSWRKVTRTVNSNYNLIFEGIRGSSFESDIAIDNVTVSEGNCPANYSTTSIPSTAVLSPTPVNGIHPTPASAMPSSFYSVSSVNVLPNPSQFELHLPSGCEQICSNTYGSYTCSCVGGYQLAPDGKSCLDIDECSFSNGGCSHHCFNIPGSFYCGCPEGRTMGANNLTCVEPGVSVHCGDSNMTVSLEKRTFPFFEVSHLHLRYSSCRATQNDTHLLISTPLNGCGTLVNETQDDLIFWNEIQADVVIIDNVITRTHDIKLPFYCSYSRRKLLSLSFTPQPVFFVTEGGYGNLTFKIDFYKSPSFTTPYSQQDFPLLVELNDYLYIRYSVESGKDLTVMAVNCKATKDGSFYSWPQYNIIQNGCPRDTTMDYSYDRSRSFQQFKIKTFRFFNDYDTVYFHCELLACYRYSPNSRCNQGCSIGNKRKKRDVTRDEVEHVESTNKFILTQGPLVFKKEEQQSGDTEQNKQNSAALIGGAAAAGGFGLIAFIALAVLFVKYRIARRFMNRNKVGDLYTTQDQQLSRKHAYIQEDDMIDNEDAL